MNEQPDFCDKCNSDKKVRVIDTRASARGRLRRYYCLGCHMRWSTNERKSSMVDIGKLNAQKTLVHKVNQLASLVEDMKVVAQNIQ